MGFSSMFLLKENVAVRAIMVSCVCQVVPIHVLINGPQTLRFNGLLERVTDV